MQTHTIGTRHKRVDARGKTTGATRFITDISVNDMLFAAPVFSKIPYGRLLGINSEPASSDPDYVACLTAGDIPGENQVGVILEDQPLMAFETLRFIGDSVGILVARTAEAAQRLADLVELQVEELEPVLSIDESRDSQGPFLHESNLACEHRVKRGDPEAGFAAADRIIEARFQTPYQEHYYLEPQGVIAVPDGQGGIFIQGSLQCPFYVQKAVSKVLDLPFPWYKWNRRPPVVPLEARKIYRQKSVPGLPWRLFGCKDRLK